VYTRNGQVWREEQAGDYPRFDESLPDPNPRGCQKGACFSDYVNADQRVTHPLRRTGERGEGKWERISWDEALTEIAEEVIDAVEDEEYDAISGFTPIPAMSPVSFASGSRLVNLLGGVSHSFYDWYPTSRRDSRSRGDPDRERRERGLVQRRLHHRVGLEHQRHADPRCEVLPRSRLRRRQARRHLHRLQPDGDPLRRVDRPGARQRHGARARDGAHHRRRGALRRGAFKRADGHAAARPRGHREVPPRARCPG